MKRQTLLIILSLIIGCESNRIYESTTSQKNDNIAWGEEEDGLRYGISYLKQSTLNFKEDIYLTVHIKNTTEQRKVIKKVPLHQTWVNLWDSNNEKIEPIVNCYKKHVKANPKREPIIINPGTIKTFRVGLNVALGCSSFYKVDTGRYTCNYKSSQKIALTINK